MNVSNLIREKTTSLYQRAKHPDSISDYISGLFIKNFYIPLLTFIIVLIFSILLAWGNYFLILLYLPVFFAFLFVFFPYKRKIGERIWNVACPNCGNYMPLAEWKCLCNTNYRGRHILEGCPGDGTRYGSGEDSEIRSVECMCGHELDFNDPYPFKKWSILEKGEESDKEFIPVKRETWMYAIGTSFTFGGAITALYLMIKDIPYPHSTPISPLVMIIVAGIIALGEVFIFLEPRVFYPRKYIRNPKYKGGHE